MKANYCTKIFEYFRCLGKLKGCTLSSYIFKILKDFFKILNLLYNFTKCIEKNFSFNFCDQFTKPEMARGLPVEKFDFCAKVGILIGRNRSY